MSYIGTRLDGRYLIEELIGEGGMADVYRGVDMAENRPVAVKILKSEYRGNDELVRRFMNESRAISVLNHPSIVKVYDVSVTDKVHYIVMELISGITLKEYIEQRGEPLTYKEVVHFLSQILRALQHAHDKGIIHRDIKPQNIMILEDGSVKVMDFGIARLARSEIRTSEDQAIGSVHYISPEQAQGADTDMRADIYSLGIMLYEMLSGTLPFEDDNAVAIAVKQISDEAVPLNQVNPSVPQGLCDITMKAMAKDPAMRYQSALDMLRDVEEFKQNPSIRFEYEYLAENSPTRYINRVMSTQAAASTPKPKNGRPANGKDPRKKKKRRIKKIGFLVPLMLGVTLAVVGICGLYSYNLLQNGDNPFFGTIEDIQLPNFVGMGKEEVLKTLRTAPYNNLRVELHEEANASVPAGQVWMQNPSSDNNNMKTVKANQRLHLYISTGVATVEVPNVSGMTRQEAIRAMLELGLMPYAKAVTDTNALPGYAIGSEPEAGTMIQNAQGTVVTILVSSTASANDYQAVVPNVEGVESLQAAQMMIENAGLSLGLVTTEISAEYPPGYVLRQSPIPGTVMTVGSDVHLVIVEEPPPPPPEPEPEPPPSSSAPSVPPPSSSSEASGGEASSSSEESSSSSSP